MHCAAALAKPMVALLGPTNPHRTGPYRRPQDVLQLDLPCVPCMKSTCHYIKEMECLRAITPAKVMAAMEERLGLIEGSEAAPRSPGKLPDTLLPRSDHSNKATLS